MAIYSTLPKLGRTQIPSGSTYALVDIDGRLIITSVFSSEATYSAGDYVLHDGPSGTTTGDNLYRAKADISTAGAWDSTKWEQVTIASELKRLEGIMAGGIHYRGKTTSAIYDGSTLNPITVGGSSYTASSGDLVILDLVNVASTYATATAYAAPTGTLATYIKYDNKYYIVDEAITANENTSFSAIEPKLSIITSDPEFIWDGSAWNALGSIDNGLGALAWKDSASGTYIKPDGTGSVTIKNYTETTKYLARTTITGTNGTVNASEVTGGTSKSQWKQDSTNPTFVYGNADVDVAVTYGTANPGTDVTGVAQVDSQKTFTTTWSASNTTGAITASVSGDCLTLGAANTGTVYGVKDATGVSITPAVASNTTLTPAKAANSSRTAVNLVSDGTLTGSYTITARTPAAVASSSTTVATGATTDSADGAVVVTAVTGGTESASVTVGTTTDTVTVR